MRARPDHADRKDTPDLDSGNDVNRTADFGYEPPESDYSIVKELSQGVSEPVSEQQPLSFTITITNDGDTWLTEVPLHDEYFTEYLQYVDSVPPSTSDDASNPTGTIDWDDLTDTFGDLAPDESFTIIVNFIALKDTFDSPNGVTVNTAEVQGAKADPDGGWSPWVGDSVA